MTTLVLGLLLGLACHSEPGPKVGHKYRRNDPEVQYARGREALTSEGITRIRWGITPFVSATSVKSEWSPTLSLISSKLGMPIDTEVGDGYADLEERLLSGQIDVAIMSPYAYVQAKKIAPGLQVFATHISGGSETYGGYLVTRGDQSLDSVESLKKRRFAYVDPRSSSGWLFPASRLLDAGIHPVEDVQGHFYGSHAAVIEAVVNGQADVGATYDGALVQGRGSIVGADSLRIIARTHRIPFDAYVVRADFPPAARTALQVAMSSISTRDAVGREALAPLLSMNGFMAITDSHYKMVRTVDSEVRAAIEASGTGLPSIIAPPPALDP